MEGGLKELYDDRDWILGGEETFVKHKNRHQTIQEFNQLSEYIHRNSCTIFGLMGSIGYNLGIKFTQEEVERASLRAIEDGVVDPNSGATFIGAVNFIRKYMKEIYNIELVSYRIPIGGSSYLKVLENGWSAGIGYRTSRQLREDVDQDGIAQFRNYPHGVGHLIHSIHLDKAGMINSYYGDRKYNRFMFKQFQALINNGLFFSFAYVLLPKQLIDMDPQHKQDILMIKKALELGITNNEQNLRDIEAGNYTVDVRMILFVMRSREL